MHLSYDLPRHLPRGLARDLVARDPARDPARDLTRSSSRLQGVNEELRRSLKRLAPVYAKAKLSQREGVAAWRSAKKAADIAEQAPEEGYQHGGGGRRARSKLCSARKENSPSPKPFPPYPSGRCLWRRAARGRSCTAVARTFAFERRGHVRWRRLRSHRRVTLPLLSPSLQRQSPPPPAGYEEAQSRLRMSCACKDMVRDLAYPLTNRIVEMASFISQLGRDVRIAVRLLWHAPACICTLAK